MPLFADVAVNSGQPGRTAFTYGVPAGMAITPGMAVFVPYGPRILQGVVLALKDTTELGGVRPIDAIADDVALLDERRIALARWLSQTYLAPLWDCIELFLPPGYGQKSVVMVSPVEIPPLLPIYPRDQKVLRYLAAHGQVTMEALRAATGPITLQRLQRLQDEGFLTVAQGLHRPTGRPRFERRVRLLRTPAEATAEATALREANPRSVEARLLAFLAVRPRARLAVLRELGAHPAHLRRLEDRGWVEAYEAHVERDPIDRDPAPELPPLQLTDAQQAAADALWDAGGGLVHGVTGSGKTEVYLDLVRRALDEGRGAIVLVPEIALTPQALRRFGERFANELTVIHSGLGIGERFDQWWRIARGESQLVVGSRSALFAPVRDLGLVVIDEEHEWTYKQTDPQPRYHARSAAAELCRLSSAESARPARLVLGSATPDVVTYHRALTGQIPLVELSERVVAGPDGELHEGSLPDIQIVDMRDELKSQNRSVFSRPLRRAVVRALKAGEQSLLFVNRRGSARFVLCRDCGFVATCPACEVALSLDFAEAHHPTLTCHHCGRSRRLEERCPRCAGWRYRPFGTGTQSIELAAREGFPGARVLRWDSETASRKGAHAAFIRAIERREVDIVVGTQIIAKGLDLPALTVVGVVDADVGLGLPDYTAHERTFQLLSQVSGRAGRRDQQGHVVIQTYQPDAPAIVCAAAHDYRSFYDYEAAHRRRAGYPPFSRLVRLTLSASNSEKGLEEAARVASEIRLARDAAGQIDPDVLGPTPAYIARLRGYSRWNLLLRGREPAKALEGIRLGRGWHVDVDPAGLL